MYEFQKHLKRDGATDGDGLLFNKWVWAGNNHYLSIQCSKYHYCYPKENLRPSEYEQYEVLIVERKPDMNDFIEHTENEEINKYLKEYGHAGLMEYMPVEEVEKLYEIALKEWGD